MRRASAGESAVQAGRMERVNGGITCRQNYKLKLRRD